MKKKTAKKSAAKPKVKAKKVKSNGIKLLGFSNRAFLIRTIDLPPGVDPSTPISPNEFQNALRANYKNDVDTCAAAIYKEVKKFPVVVGLEALEMIFAAAVARLGDEQLKRFQEHLKQFHVELMFMESQEISTAVH